jgi:hypothetical protein
MLQEEDKGYTDHKHNNNDENYIIIIIIIINSFFSRKCKVIISGSHYYLGKELSLFSSVSSHNTGIMLLS